MVTFYGPKVEPTRKSSYDFKIMPFKHLSIINLIRVIQTFIEICTPACSTIEVRITLIQLIIERFLNGMILKSYDDSLMGGHTQMNTKIP